MCRFCESSCVTALVSGNVFCSNLPKPMAPIVFLLSFGRTGCDTAVPFSAQHSTFSLCVPFMVVVSNIMISSSTCFLPNVMISFLAAGYNLTAHRYYTFFIHPSFGWRCRLVSFSGFGNSTAVYIDVPVCLSIQVAGKCSGAVLILDRGIHSDRPFNLTSFGYMRTT